MRLLGQKNGFTLIEISMVLVIIGLLVGGVLAGRELVRNAQLRRQVSQIESLQTAVTTFLLKFNCLPGDCENASRFGLSTPSGNGTAGDGDHILYKDIYPSAVTAEIAYFWRHLGEAGLMTLYPAGSTPGVNSPPLAMPGQGIDGNAVGGLWFANLYFEGKMITDESDSEIASVNTLFLTTTSQGGVTSGVYLPIDAYRLDFKIDDGLPMAGVMRAASGSISGGCSGAPPHCTGAELAKTSLGYVDACVDDDTSPAQYHSTVSTPIATSLCSLLMHMKF